LYLEGLKTYKNTLYGLFWVFFEVANYWGQNFNIIAPFCYDPGHSKTFSTPSSTPVPTTPPTHIQLAAPV
jgi:hypothetical protein